MRAEELYIVLQPGIDTSYTVPSTGAHRDLGYWAGVQPYIRLFSTSSDNPYTASGSGTIEVHVSGVLILSCTISGTLSANFPGTSATSISVSWAAGYIASPDVPVMSAGRSAGSKVPVAQGTFPANGGPPSFNVYLAADYTVLPIPPGAVVSIASASGDAGIVGLALSTRPLASFSATPSGASANTNASASQDSVFSNTYVDDPDNLITLYEWNWGDGNTTTTTGPTATYEYAASGTYTVTLTVYDKYAGRHSTTQNVTVVVSALRLHSGIQRVSGVSLLAEVSSGTLTLRILNGTTFTSLPSLSGYSAPCLIDAPHAPRDLMTAKQTSSSTWKLLGSEDRGRTWSVMSQPWDSTTKDAVGAATPSALLSARVNASNGVEVKASRDGGATWESMTSPGSVASGKLLAMWPARNGQARVFLSSPGQWVKYTDDAGRSWVTL